MTQEEKQLLLKDICARLPYGVIIKSISGDDHGKVIDISYPQGAVAYNGVNGCKYSEEFKPYLRPMSSMTEEEENEWSGFNIDPLLEAVGKPHTRIEDLMLRAKSQYEPFEWLNEHHFDFRGLIPMGLALEAPKDMYKTE